MKNAKVTFRCEPAINQDTGSPVPYDWHVTLLINGECFIAGDRSETSECRKAQTLRAEAFSLARRACYHPDVPTNAINALENIRGQYEAIEWVR